MIKKAKYSISYPLVSMTAPNTLCCISYNVQIVCWGLSLDGNYVSWVHKFNFCDSSFGQVYPHYVIISETEQYCTHSQTDVRNCYFSLLYHLPISVSLGNWNKMWLCERDKTINRQWNNVDKIKSKLALVHWFIHVSVNIYNTFSQCNLNKNKITHFLV